MWTDLRGERNGEQGMEVRSGPRQNLRRVWEKMERERQQCEKGKKDKKQKESYVLIKRQKERDLENGERRGGGGT